MTKKNYEDYDVDKDGMIEENEVSAIKSIREQNRADNKQKNQRRMAWVAMATMVVFTAIILSPLVDDTRVEVLSALLSTFYVAQAGVVGAYMGFAVMADRQERNAEDNY